MFLEQYLRIQSRRSFLHHCVGGVGTAALAHLLATEGRAASTGIAATNPLAPKPPHFTPRAKNVIFLFMAGAPSQIDLFDPKPELRKWHGKPFSSSLTEDLQLAFIKPNAAAMASPREFARCGEAVSKSQIGCPTLEPLPMTSAWCARWKAKPSIIIRANRCS